jgi:hypothetical protein
MPGKKIKNRGHTQLFTPEGKPRKSNNRYVWVNRKGKKIYKLPNKQRKKDLKELMGEVRRKYGITDQYQACLIIANDPKVNLTKKERIEIMKYLQTTGIDNARE